MFTESTSSKRAVMNPALYKRVERVTAKTEETRTRHFIKTGMTDD